VPVLKENIVENFLEFLRTNLYKNKKSKNKKELNKSFFIFYFLIIILMRLIKKSLLS